MKPVRTPRSFATDALGLLVVAAALSLTLPGVRSVQADEPDMTPASAQEYVDLDAKAAAPAAPTAAPEACGDPAASQPAQAKTRAQLLAGMPQAGAGEAGAEDREGVVLLNNRGYNYGAEQGPTAAQLRQIERELRAGDQ
jgi:hypothetical protein